MQFIICLHCTTFFATVSRRSFFLHSTFFLINNINFFCVWKKPNYCVYVRYFLNFQYKKKPTIEWKAPRYFIFFWFSTFLPFLRVLYVCYSANAVFLFLDSLKCVIIFTFLSRIHSLTLSLLLLFQKKILTHYFFALIKQHEIYSSLNFISTIFWLIHFLMWFFSVLFSLSVYGGTDLLLITFLSSADYSVKVKKCWRRLKNYSHRNLCCVFIIAWVERFFIFLFCRAFMTWKKMMKKKSVKKIHLISFD